MALVKITPEMAERAVREIDWTRVDALTDAEIEAAIASDPDAAPILTEEAIVAARVRGIRGRIDLSQEAFAEAYGIPIDRLRDWEDGRAVPDTMTRNYLRIIEGEPGILARLRAA